MVLTKEKIGSAEKYNPHNQHSNNKKPSDRRAFDLTAIKRHLQFYRGRSKIFYVVGT